MLSSIDIRAEAYLLGEIMPACFYWLLYDRDNKIKYLFLGALFTALALMTKGIFVLITIISPLLCLWLLQRRFHNVIRLKWIVALILSFIFIAPEIISLYLQFDSHPEKLIFATKHVSGIRWFFWDSQFGRFFNTGPISVNKPEQMRYLFFVYTMLWAYLPWWPIFFASIITTVKEKSAANVYLLTAFFIPFIIFSLTKFQIDHYTNILFPFASIISANFLYQQLAGSSRTKLILFIGKVEYGITLLLILLSLFLAPVILELRYAIIIVVFAIILLVSMYKMRQSKLLTKTLSYPTLGMCLFFIFAMLVNGIEYAKYDAGYQIARYLNQENNIQVVGYDLDLLSLDFNLHAPYNYFWSYDYKNNSPLKHLKNSVALIEKDKHTLYIITEDKNSYLILANFKHAKIETVYKGGSIETYLRNAMNKQKLNAELTTYDVIKLGPK